MGNVSHIDRAHAIRAAAAKHERRNTIQRLKNLVALLILIPLIFAVLWTLPDSWFSKADPILRYAAVAHDAEQASFGYCEAGGGRNCIVDGDTFWYQGQKIRIADIDTPETHPPRCAYEAQRGSAATARLHGLLNQGAFTLERIDRETDSYGRQLRIVTRGGASIGAVLVSEGLARWYADGRQPWC